MSHTGNMVDYVTRVHNNDRTILTDTLTDIHDIITAEISIHANYNFNGSRFTVNILFTNHSCIFSVFPIYALFSAQFTDHAKPLPDPVRIISIYTDRHVTPEDPLIS